MPSRTPCCTQEQNIDFALNLNGPVFTVGVTEEEHGPNLKPAHILPATPNPTHVLPFKLEPVQDRPIRPNPVQVMSARSGSVHNLAATPEPPHKMATALEPSAVMDLVPDSSAFKGVLPVFSHHGLQFRVLHMKMSRFPIGARDWCPV
ncbi:uncharacterized, partial [Tachysurus ichikawai]